MNEEQVEQVIDDLFTIRKNDNVPFVVKKKHSRNYLAVLFKKLGFKYGAEIGVCKGVFSKFLLENVPDLKLLCVDMWIDHGSSKGSNNYKKAIDALKGYDTEVFDMPSVDAAKRIKDNSLDFVYIDAAHDFDNVMVDIINWAKKVKVGGIISGHDYHANFQYGVIEAVNAYTRCHNVNKWYLTREIKAPSYFWVKKESHI